MNQSTLVHARRPTAYRPFPNLAHRNALQQRLEVPSLVRLLDLPAGRRVLEVGCGRGVALVALARLCRPTYLAGLDIDRTLIAEAHTTLARAGVQAELVVGDVCALPFASASLDVVVDFGTSYHIDRPEAALAEIERVLAPCGVFVHETPFAQLLAHPARSLGRSLPWAEVPLLRRERTALLWSRRVKS